MRDFYPIWEQGVWYRAYASFELLMVLHVEKEAGERSIAAMLLPSEEGVDATEWQLHTGQAVTMSKDNVHEVEGCLITWGQM
jgi:hypothetical protein